MSRRQRQREGKIASFLPHEVLPYTAYDAPEKHYVIDGQIYRIHMQSTRYQCFKRSLYCVVCGLEGTIMILERKGNWSPHFNLYAEFGGALVLMTKDHIVPHSKGGPDHISNLRTCCTRCNEIKGHHDMTDEQILGKRFAGLLA